MFAGGCKVLKLEMRRRRLEEMLFGKDDSVSCMSELAAHQMNMRVAPSSLPL